MRHKSIVAWAVIMLGLNLASCSKDEPTKGNQPTPETENQGKNNEATEVVSVDFEMTEEEANSARSLNYTLTDGYSPNNMKLSDNQQDKLSALLILRNPQLPEPHGTAYKEILLTRHSNNGKSVWIYRGRLRIVKGYNKEPRDSWYAMIVTGGVHDIWGYSRYPDGSNYGQLGSQGNESLSIKSHVSKVVDLNQGNEVNLDIPYASTWRQMKWNERTESFQIIGENRLKLFPLGIVMTYRLTNNMNLPSGVDGIRVMTNHLEGTGSYSLAKDDLPTLPTSSGVPTNEVAPALKWTADEQNKANDASVLYGNDGSAGFRQYNYTLSTEMVAKAKTSKKVVVAWYQPNNKPTRVDFTDANSALGAYALTHVYAVGAKNASGTITKPNYEVVPIMGSDVQLTSGKKYEMPCELYEQPNMQLGYFAQTLMRHAGDPKTANVTVADNKLLSSAEQYNPRYVAHLSQSNATTALGSIKGKNGSALGVPLKSDIVWGLGFVVGGNLTESRGARRAINSTSSNVWSTGDLQTINTSGGRDVARSFLALNSNGGGGQNVSVLYRADEVGVGKEKRKDPLLNLYQSAYRLTVVRYTNGEPRATIWNEQNKWTSSSGANSKTPWFGDLDAKATPTDSYNARAERNDKSAFQYLKVESIYLGKYYLGDVEVIRNSEKLFDSRHANKVERHLPIAGKLVQNSGGVWPQSWQDDVRNVGLTMIPLFQKVVDSATDVKNHVGVRYNSSLYSVKSGHETMFTNRPVLPISTTYQGDNARPTN